jgi:hypothetical protein
MMNPIGHCGQEGEQLIFKVLNADNFLANILPENYADYKKLVYYVAGKRLQYDLTVPLMRSVQNPYKKRYNCIK